MHKSYPVQIQPLYMAFGKGWGEINGSEPLHLWFMTEDYNVNLIVQQACKMLQRMNRPQTVDEFLSIDPANYRGFWGIGEKRYPVMVNLRQQFLETYPQLDQRYYVHDTY
jgi:hypothetical protein